GGIPAAARAADPAGALERERATAAAGTGEHARQQVSYRHGLPAISREIPRGNAGGGAPEGQSARRSAIPPAKSRGRRDISVVVRRESGGPTTATQVSQ